MAGLASNTATSATRPDMVAGPMLRKWRASNSLATREGDAVGAVVRELGARWAATAVACTGRSRSVPAAALRSNRAMTKGLAEKREALNNVRHVPPLSETTAD